MIHFGCFSPVRVCLLLALLSMMGATWLLENPGHSTITLHPWLQWLVKTIRKAGGRESFLELSNVFNQLLLLVDRRPKSYRFGSEIWSSKFWVYHNLVGGCRLCPLAAEVFKFVFSMRHYKAKSVKPTMIITNNEVMGGLSRGKLRRCKRKGAKPTTKRYRDGEGKARFCGTASLKESQILGTALLQVCLYIYIIRSGGDCLVKQNLLDTSCLKTNSGSSGKGDITHHNTSIIYKDQGIVYNKLYIYIHTFLSNRKMLENARK